MSSTRSKRMGMWKPKAFRSVIPASEPDRVWLCIAFCISSFVNHRLLQKRVLQLVPVVGQARCEGMIGVTSGSSKPPMPFQVVDHLLLLVLELLGVGEVLPLAATAGTEVFAESRYTIRRMVSRSVW